MKYQTPEVTFQFLKKKLTDKFYKFSYDYQSSSNDESVLMIDRCQFIEQPVANAVVAAIATRPKNAGLAAPFTVML